MDIYPQEGEDVIVLGRSQGYRGLYIRNQGSVDRTNSEETNEMISLWVPTYDELMQLMSGGLIELTVMGKGHPPVRISVVAGPTEWPSAKETE